MRVARDVLWNGAFSESEVCTEYYAGLLAASRSVDGLDDETVPFVDAVKSLSSQQLKLHYSIYHSLERIMEQAHDNGEAFDVYQISKRDVFIVGEEDIDTIDLNLQVLLRKGLITNYEHKNKNITREGREQWLFYYRARPTVFGIFLYAAAHNQLEGRRAFGLRPFGQLEGVEPPEFYGRTLEELLNRLP